MATKVKVYCDSNLTPIYLANEKWKGNADKKNPQWVRNDFWHDLMVSLGCRETFMIYDGTVNRAPMWSDDAGNPIAPQRAKNPDVPWDNGMDCDWTREGNNSNPPREMPVKACSRLAMNSNLYGAPGPKIRPMIFDFENPSMQLDLTSSDQKAAEAVAQRMFDTVNWAREVNPSANSPIFWFANPPMVTGQSYNSELVRDNYDLWQTQTFKSFSRVLDASTACFYWWNLPAMSHFSWFDGVDLRTRQLDKHYSDMPRIATVCPTYQIWWNDTSLMHMNLKAVPNDLWTKSIKYLVERDYDIYLWTVNSPDTPGVSTNLRTALKYNAY